MELDEIIKALNMGAFPSFGPFMVFNSRVDLTTIYEDRIREFVEREALDFNDVLYFGALHEARERTSLLTQPSLYIFELNKQLISLILDYEEGLYKGRDDLIWLKTEILRRDIKIKWIELRYAPFFDAVHLISAEHSPHEKEREVAEILKKKILKGETKEYYEMLRKICLIVGSEVTLLGIVHCVAEWPMPVWLNLYDIHPSIDPESRLNKLLRGIQKTSWFLKERLMKIAPRNMDEFISLSPEKRSKFLCELGEWINRLYAAGNLRKENRSIKAVEKSSAFHSTMLRGLMKKHELSFRKDFPENIEGVFELSSFYLFKRGDNRYIFRRRKDLSNEEQAAGITHINLTCLLTQILDGEEKLSCIIAPLELCDRNCTNCVGKDYLELSREVAKAYHSVEVPSLEEIWKRLKEKLNPSSSAR
ncbi:MAG: hypothetical protein ACUVTD_02510 [Nitrososphaerales archaeon]